MSSSFITRQTPSTSSAAASAPRCAADPKSTVLMLPARAEPDRRRQPLAFEGRHQLGQRAGLERAAGTRS